MAGKEVSMKEIAKRNREGREEILQQLPRYVRVNTLKTSFGNAQPLARVLSFC